MSEEKKKSFDAGYIVAIESFADNLEGLISTMRGIVKQIRDYHREKEAE